MRTFHRLRLLYLIFAPYLAILQFSTLCPVETMASPSKTYYRELPISYVGPNAHSGNHIPREYVFGGDGRSRTAVQNTFQLPSPNTV